MLYKIKENDLTETLKQFDRNCILLKFVYWMMNTDPSKFITFQCYHYY